MKAKPVIRPPAGDWSYEIKFDGWRALALKAGNHVQLISRNKKDFSQKFPEIISSLLQVRAQDIILDGEIVALNKNGVSSFQLLQAYEIGTKRPPIYFYAFDILQLNGKDLKKKPLEERKAMLEGNNPIFCRSRWRRSISLRTSKKIWI
jgi:bifunctional non-homologous end joining protein LigD